MEPADLRPYRGAGLPDGMGVVGGNDRPVAEILASTPAHREIWIREKRVVPSR